MADEMNDTEKDVVENAASGGLSTTAAKDEKFTASYQVMGDAKIPVSKHMGSVWKGRRDHGKKAIKSEVERWEEALRYFDNDQYSHRTPREGTSGNIDVSMRRNKIHSETENIVYANVMAMIPALYAKNPNGEITGYDDSHEPILQVGERLIKALCAMKVAPGFNLRSKLRRCVAAVLLMNEAWIIYGYNKKEDSNEQQLEEINQLGLELEKAKDTKEIKEIEGKLMALEEASDFLSAAGPTLRVMSGRDMLVDPDCNEDDFTDAKWIMYPLLLPANYVQAKYGKKGEDGNYHSIYQPTVVLSAKDKDKDSEHEDFDTMGLFDKDKEHSAYGYDTKEAYDRACYTKVWYVWDKVTRRLYMFNDKDWSWPIWVFNDPYGIKSFFPVKKLSFNAHPFKLRNRGEVSYYLDQQDAINEVNDEANRIRKGLKFKILFNKEMLKDAGDLDKFFDNETQKALGVSVPEGQKIADLLSGPPFPALQHKEFFDKQQLYAAVDRIANTSEIMRGAQFKTNTTNKAIEEYNSFLNQKYDEKIDAIEEFIGDILADILTLCIKFMTVEEVIAIIGNEEKTAPAWDELKRLTENQIITYRVVGGSTQKPTSAAKKQEALQMGQILGQFASASPAVVLVTLKMFQKAFDDFIITTEDWDLIRQSVEQAMQAQSGDGGGEGGMDPRMEEQVVQRMMDKGVDEQTAREKVKSYLQQRGSGNGSARPQ